MITKPTGRSGPWVPALVLALAALGCSTHHPTVPVADGGPVPDTPAHAVQLLQWSWSHRDIETTERLLTDDYRFVFVPADSVDNLPIHRDDELSIDLHLFKRGTATLRPANRIELDLVTPLVAVADPRPGKEAPWHQSIAADVGLRVETPDAIYLLNGPIIIYLVRADSAAIPRQLLERGATPRPDRWYIDRIDDRTGQILSAIDRPTTPLLDTELAHRLTWGQLKALYR